MSSSQHSVNSVTSRRSSLSSNSSSAAVFSQRIVQVDFYTAIPISNLDIEYSEFRGKEVRRVPVIRIFGATPKGQKVCTHIHGVFPYLYISFPYDYDQLQQDENFEQRLAFALDKAITSALNWNSNGAPPQHVYKILKVTGRPFYGYKFQEGVFLKIYFYSPIGLRKGEEILQSGEIFGRHFQPHESHIPYVLQFFMDFKLYGMNFIHFRNVKFRRQNESLPCKSSSGSLNTNPITSGGILNQSIWNISEIPGELLLPINVLRKSRCELEIDVLASDIIVSQSSIGKNPGIEAIWMDEKERRRLHQIEDWSNVTIPNSQDRVADDFVFPRERELLDQLRTTLQTIQSPEKDSGFHPVHSESNNFDCSQIDIPPASQTFLNDDFEIAGVRSPNRPSQRRISELSEFGIPEVEMNEEDNDIIAMMEDMARERVTENDSIIGDIGIYLNNSQEVDHQSEDDEEEDMSHVPEPVPELEPENVEDDLKEWSQESLSESVLEYMEDVERKELEEKSTAASSFGSGKQEQRIDQCDGQFDNSSSEEDDSASGVFKKKRKRQKIEFERDEETKTKNKSVNTKLKRHSSSASLLSLKFRKQISQEKLEMESEPKHGSQPSASTSISAGTSRSARLPLRKSIVQKSETNSEDSDVVFLKSDSPRKSVELINLGSTGSLDKFEGVASVEIEDQDSPESEIITLDEDEQPPSNEGSSTVSESEFTIVTCENPGNVNGVEEGEVPRKNPLLEDIEVPGTHQTQIEDEEHQAERREDVGRCIEETGEESSANQSLGIRSFYEYSQSLSLEAEGEDEILDSQVEHTQGPYQEKSITEYVLEIEKSNKIVRKTHSEETRKEVEDQEGDNNSPFRILSSPENQDELGNQSLGITSFYEYSQSEVVQDEDEMDVEENDLNKSSIGGRPRPENHTDSESSSNMDRNEDSEDNKTMEAEEFSGSDSTSVNSMYGSDSPSGSSSEDVTPDNTSFADISSQFSCRGNDSSDTEASSQSEFERMREKRRNYQRLRNQMENVEGEKRRPSVFSHTLQPLKRPLNSTDYHDWLCKRGRRRMAAGKYDEPEPWNLAYSRFNQKSKVPIEVIQARRSYLADILDYRDQYEGTIPNQATTSVTATATTAGTSESKPKSHRVPIAADSDESSDDDDEITRVVKPFRFTSGNDDASDLSASGSEFDLSDTETNKTVVASPRPNSSQLFTPSPSASHGSHRRNSTPATGKGSGKFRRRPSQLNISRRTSLNLPSGESQSQSSEQSGSACGLPLPKFRPNDSELDSPSSRLSESEKIDVNLEDLDESNFQNAKAFHEFQYLTTLVMEVHCASRGDFVPDPERDQINGIFYVLHTDSAADNVISGHYLVGTPPTEQDSQENSVEYFNDEISMVKKFILLIHDFDPDILIGYEIQKSSWGYLIERGCKLGLNILQEFSRLLPLPYQSKTESQNQDSLESWNESVSGRIVLNLWKLLRHEITVTSYTFESVVFHILHERVHRLSYEKLSEYWNTEETKTKVIQYFRRRVDYNMRLIGKLDLINRTSELARLFGIQFFEVLSRGSQFRVESMMLRLAKPVNLIPPSPNPQQRSKMKAPEYLPLIMEPESKFYTDPVAVLDFQSLYPSMMMAYNYCFSTCIGRVHHLGQNDEFDFGCLSHKISPMELASLLAEDCIHISPCGVVFVKHQVRRGILGDMLEQILDTRQMVKRAMKKWKNDETLQKVLDSRQLGLKLIANVTYGYTSANFSGRMPCIEIADSVVSKGRETLQRAIDYVKKNGHVFGGKVVYGDTDSLFVHFPGKTRAEAFVLAQRIVDDVTASNPKPVKLKLEKVYQPCILQTKKRYVGFAYETPDQKEPKYDAKGIETVRRDGCPATAKILEGTLKILFTTKDEIAVKKFVVEQFRKIFLGRVSLSKYMFARVYRGRMGYRPGACVASLEIAKKLAEKDPRSEPLPKERVPYIIVYGVPGSTLLSRARRPEEFIGNPNLRLDSHYYIEKSIIPALNRCLALANLNVHKWYSEMPRRYLQSHYTDTAAHKKGTIEQYFARENCIKCNAWTQTGFCDNCFPTLDDLKAFLIKLKNDIVRKYESCTTTCQNCSGEADMICVNMSCSIKHKYLRYERDYKTKLPATLKLHSNVFGYDLDW